jgi:hypothetical protein
MSKWKHMNTKSRHTFRRAARQIAANRNESPATAAQAFRKLFIQERCAWNITGAPRIGWKRGELFEVLLARSPAERAAEWGDVGYYVAQTWTLLWWLYAAATPHTIIKDATDKFTARAKGEKW